MNSSCPYIPDLPEEGYLARVWIAPDLNPYEAEIRKIHELDLRRDENTVILKENRIRTVYKAIFPFFDAPVLVKSFHYPTARRLLKEMVTPYADRELARALAARKRGIPVAEPLFLIRRKRRWRPVSSMVGFRFLEGSSLYDAFSGRQELRGEIRQRWLWAAGEFTARLHEKGGRHRDYHAGNLFVLDDGTLILIDLYPLSLGTAPIRVKERIEGLAHLMASLAPFINREDTERLLEGYRSRLSLSDQEWDMVLIRQREIRRRHERSRSRRCMENSSEFYQARFAGGRISARRSWPLDMVRKLITTFLEDYRKNPDHALKNAPESVILNIEAPHHQRVCVKWYRKRGLVDTYKERLRGGRAQRAWKSGNALLVRGIPVAVPYAMARTPLGGFLVMASLAATELDRWLGRELEQQPAGWHHRLWRMAETLGALLGRMHEQGIFHADLKACNIMVEEKSGSMDLVLLDYDRVEFFDTLPRKFMIKNLIQLNNSIPRKISRGVRYRFLRAYKRQFPNAPEIRDLFREVWKESQGKTIVYVTERGDRIESWES